MDDTLKKINKLSQSRRTLMILVVICAIISAIIFGNWIIDKINLAINGEPDFTQLSQSEIKQGLFVTGTIEAAIGPYAKEFTRYSDGRTSEPSLDNYYYLVPIFSENGDTIDYFVSFEARHHYNDRHDMEKIAEATWQGEEPKPLLIEHGRMTKLKKEQEDILKEWATEPDYYEGGSFVDYCVQYNLMGTTDKNTILAKIVTYNIGREWHAGIELSNILYPLVPGIFFALWILLIDVVQKRRKEQYKTERERQLQQLNGDDNAFRL